MLLLRSPMTLLTAYAACVAAWVPPARNTLFSSGPGATVFGATVFPEQPYPDMDHDPIGVAFSGGGTRAQVGAFATLNAISQAGLLKSVKYIGSNSGGTWGTLQLMYSAVAYSESTRKQIPGYADPKFREIWDTIVDMGTRYDEAIKRVKRYKSDGTSGHGRGMNIEEFKDEFKLVSTGPVFMNETTPFGLGCDGIAGTIRQFTDSILQTIGYPPGFRFWQDFSSALLNEYPINSKHFEMTRVALKNVEYVATTAIPPDAYYQEPGHWENSYGSQNYKEHQLRFGDSTMVPTSTRNLVDTYDLFALPLAYVSMPEGESGSGWEVPAAGKAEGVKNLAIDTSTGRQSLDLPDNPTLDFVAASSSAAVGVTGSPTILKKLLREHPITSNIPFLTLTDCVPAGLANLAPPTYPICFANAACGGTSNKRGLKLLHYWNCGDFPTTEGWRGWGSKEDFVENLPELTNEQCYDCDAYDMYSGSWRCDYKYDYSWFLTGGECCNPLNCHGDGCADDGALAKKATYRLMDGGYVDNTAVPFLLARMQKACDKNELGKCVKPLKLIILNNNQPGTVGKEVGMAASPDLLNLFSTPCVGENPETSVGCGKGASGYSTKEFVKNGRTPGEPIATGVMPVDVKDFDVMIPSPIVFQDAFPDLDKGEAGFLGKWTAYAFSEQEKECLSNGICVDNSKMHKKFPSLFWSGKLTTRANPAYGTEDGDTVDVLILSPQWPAETIVPISGDQAPEYFKETMAPFAHFHAKYAKEVIRKWATGEL